MSTESNQSHGHSIDDTTKLLQLAARLHTARANPQVWRETLLAFRGCTRCSGLLDLATDAPSLSPDDMAALAGRITHCAEYGDECGEGESLNRAVCAAFAVHMHTAAFSARKTLQAGLFEHLPPTWIVDRNAQIHEANSAAKGLAKDGECVTVVGTRLELVGVGGAKTLLRALVKVSTPTRLEWQDCVGKPVSFWLRALPDTIHVVVTALLDAPVPVVQALVLAEQLGLTPRQSELAAHLLADQTLASAAREMDISRHTANEHLVALQRRTGVPDRRALLIMLRRIVQR